ncbi:MAG: ATP-binding protein [Candidatus Aenigmarchaeota archaeon]|nr:ATP-binding protein [Candidatus Aenigmarchaeota archaeon]
MQEIGTVISTLEGPSTSEFSFVIAETKEIPIRKGQYVQLNTEDGLLIARVAEIIKTNRYFMQAEAVSEYGREGKAMDEFFPVDRWEYLVANATPLGIWDNGIQRRASFPPSPGTKVYRADEKILFDFLGLDAERGLAIGSVEFHELEARLNLTKLFQKHCSVLAQTGFGKSYLVAVLIEEILKRSDELGKPALIVVDPHGEYLGFTQDRTFSTKTKIFRIGDLEISANNLSSYQIAEFQPHITYVGKRELAKVISQLKNEKRAYGMDELIQAVEASDITPKTKGPLLAWISELARSLLFGKIDRPSVQELAKPGQLSILDLSDFIHLRDRQILLTHLARKLFNSRRANEIPPFILFVEESHQFCPEQVERSQAISKGIIETIAREGRKFNACLVLISQRPIQLSTTALSQCDSHIIMHVSNPYDLDHIAKSCEGITKDVLKSIPGLKVGEAIITGEVVNYPLLVKVRERESKISEKGARLEDAILNFNKEFGKKIEDLDAFR